MVAFFIDAGLKESF